MPSVNCENSNQTGCITKLSADDKLASSPSLPPLDLAFDHIVICRSISLNQAVEAQLLAKKFHKGSSSSPKDYVIERVFIEDCI